MAKSSSGMRHLELHTLYQGFCYLSASSPPSSTSPPSTSWHKRYAVILESGLVFFDPAAGRGSPVDKIRARDMQSVRLLPHDPKGQTLEIFLAPPQSILQVHLCTVLVTRHWLHILLHVLLPQAHNSSAPMRAQELFSSLPGGDQQLEAEQNALYLRGENEGLASADQPATQSTANAGFGALESSFDVQMPSVSGNAQLSEDYNDSTKYHVKVDPLTKRFLRQAQSLKRHTISSEDLQLSRKDFDANENCIKLDSQEENILLGQEKEGSNGNSSCSTNMKRFSGDVLTHNVLIRCPDTPSLDCPTGLIVDEDDPSSGPLSLLNSPESESMKKLEQSSSEGSISGLTLTSDSSSEVVEGLARDGYKFWAPLVESSSKDIISDLASSKNFHGSDALPDLSVSMSSEAPSTSNPEQEPKLSEELPASLSFQKVRQSMEPSSLHLEHTQKDDRSIEGCEKMNTTKEIQFVEKKAAMDAFEPHEMSDSEEVSWRRKASTKS